MKFQIHQRDADSFGIFVAPINKLKHLLPLRIGFSPCLTEKEVLSEFNSSSSSFLVAFIALAEDTLSLKESMSDLLSFSNKLFLMNGNFPELRCKISRAKQTYINC